MLRISRSFVQVVARPTLSCPSSSVLFVWRIARAAVDAGTGVLPFSVLLLRLSSFYLVNQTKKSSFASVALICITP